MGYGGFGECVFVYVFLRVFIEELESRVYVVILVFRRCVGGFGFWREYIFE